MSDYTTPMQSAKGKAGAAKSPWRKGPHADTGRAKASYIQYRKRGKAGPK